MTTKAIANKAIFVVTAVSLCGCITSDPDPTLMHQYQRYLNAAGPQQRLVDALVKPVPGTTGAPLETGTDEETGRTMVYLSINEAVTRALYNNPTVKVISYDPAIAREDVIQAEAEFDPVLTASFLHEKTDVRPALESSPDQTWTTSFETVLSKKFANGLEASVAYSVDKFRQRPEPAQFSDPGNPVPSLRGPLDNFDPAYTQSVSVNLVQPLLRNFGADANLAQIRISRINEKIASDQFRQTVLDTINETQQAYWQLYAAQQTLEIRIELVARSESTLAQVRARKYLDASKVQITDAEATVASNKLALIRAQRAIGDARDQLVRLMADASITLLDDFDIVLTTPVTTAPLIIDSADQVAAAMRFSPELAQARKAIEAQEVAVKLARNQVLPQLDLVQTFELSGVARTFERSWAQLNGGDYAGYGVGLSFEWPLANRARRANLRKAKYNRSRSIATLQDTADQVALAVNTVVRQINSNYDLIVAGRESLKANQANLTALDVRKKFRQALTPDFLNRLLNQQGDVALAELELLDAEVTYNTAQASLSRVTGTSLNDFGVVVVSSDEGVVPLMMSRLEITGDQTVTPAPTTQPTALPDLPTKPTPQPAEQPETKSVIEQPAEAAAEPKARPGDDPATQPADASKVPAVEAATQPSN